MSKLREAKWPRPQRLQWTTAVPEIITVSFNLLGKRKKSQTTKACFSNFLLLYTASFTDYNRISACYQHKRMKKRENILKFRILMLTAELNGLNADSRVWMKKPRSLFPSFWRMWSHKFSFRLNTLMLKTDSTQHLQIILTVVRTAAAQIIQDLSLWPIHQSFSCSRTYFSSATAMSWKPCAVMLFLSHITVLRGGRERKEKKCYTRTTE